MLDFVTAVDQAGASRHCWMRAVAQLRRRCACRAHALRLAKLNQMLAAIHRQFSRAHAGESSPVPLESLRRVGAGVRAELANPPARPIAASEYFERYLVGVDDVIRSYAELEAMLDEKALRQLDWVEQQVRLEYLRAGVAARTDEPTGTSGDRRGERAIGPGACSCEQVLFRMAGTGSGR